MTRGQIVILVDFCKLITSGEFNGDMYYDEYGKMIIEALKEINTTEEYEDYVKEFSRMHYSHIKNDYTYPIFGTRYIKCLDMTKDYFDNWFSDYLYVKNLSNEIVNFITEDGFASLEPGKIGVFYFGRIARKIKENELLLFNDPEKQIRWMVDDDNCSMTDMYEKAFEFSLGDTVYTREALIDIMYEHAKGGDTFSEMAKDLDENRDCDYFLFDWSCWGFGCTPIKNKQEMADALIYGVI